LQAPLTRHHPTSEVWGCSGFRGGGRGGGALVAPSPFLVAAYDGRELGRSWESQCDPTFEITEAFTPGIGVRPRVDRRGRSTKIIFADASSVEGTRDEEPRWWVESARRLVRLRADRRGRKKDQSCGVSPVEAAQRLPTHEHSAQARCGTVVRCIFGSFQSISLGAASSSTLEAVDPARRTPERRVGC
jgi:hypothetical protein